MIETPHNVCVVTCHFNNSVPRTFGVRKALARNVPAEGAEGAAGSNMG